MTQFSRSWKRAWEGLNLQGDGAALRDQILARYREPHRAYHDVQHLGECLEVFEEVGHLAENPFAVECALWFHDAIYDPTRSDSEEASALWAAEELESAGADEAVALVRDLILATRHAALPNGRDEQVLVDIDLSILGADSERFDEYEEQIRREYAFVPETVFREKRATILESFLARPSIYGCEEIRAARESSARRNLVAALRLYGLRDRS